MQHCPGTNADSDATWQRSQANATARTRRRIEFMFAQSNGNGWLPAKGGTMCRDAEAVVSGGNRTVAGGVHRQQTAARSYGDCRARVGAVKAGVAVSHLQLWRDSYYTVTDGGATVALAGDREEQILTMYVHAGHYLALGDNSAASADSRSWGVVPQRLLLGRALVVYYPFWPFVSQSRAGLIR